MAWSAVLEQGQKGTGHCMLMNSWVIDVEVKSLVRGIENFCILKCFYCGIENHLFLKCFYCGIEKHSEWGKHAQPRDCRDLLAASRSRVESGQTRSLP